MAHIIGLKEFRENTGEYEKRVARGESFLVLKRSRPVFKLVSPNHDEIWEEVIDFTKVKKGGVDIDDIISRL